MYNLLKEPWLPVTWNSGAPPSEVGLREVLHRAHEITELATDNPLETVALNRMLAALVASVFDELPDGQAWLDLWTEGQFDADQCDEYFAEYADRFDLLSADRPFYGHPVTDTENLSPLTRLQHAAASGNNAALFSHTLDEQPIASSLAEAARSLVCAQSAALGGGVAKPFNLSHAPLVGGAVFWIRGVADAEASLFRALMLNLVPSERVWGNDLHDDQAAWEPSAPPEPKKRNARGLRDLLTFQSRRLQLALNDEAEAIGVYYNQGSKLEELPFHDPHMAYRENENGFYPLKLNAARALWRDSTTFMMTRRRGGLSGKEYGHAPRTFEWLSQPDNLRELGLDKQAAFSVDVFGLVNDKAKIELWQRERLTLFPSILEDVDRWSVLGSIINFAEHYAKSRLREAARAFASRSRLNAPWGTRLGDIARRERDDFVRMLAADQRYWPVLGTLFNRFLAQIASEPIATLDTVQQAWKKLVRRTGEDALQQSIEPFAQSARSLQAQAEAQTVLWYGTLYPKSKPAKV